MSKIILLAISLSYLTVAIAQPNKVKPKVTVKVAMGVPKGSSQLNKAYSAKITVIYNSATPQEIKFASVPQFNGKTIFKMNEELPQVELTQFSELEFSIEPQNNSTLSLMASKIKSELDKNKKEPDKDAMESFKSILSSSGSNPLQILQTFIQKNTN